MENELRFPLNFTQCPTCGSTRRLANEVLEGEKEKGRVGPAANAFLFMHQSAIMDARKTVLSAPVILSFHDACVDCGTVYCIHTEVKVGTPGTQRPGGPGFSTS